MAGRLIAEVRGGLDADMHPHELYNKQIVSLHQLLHEAKFKDPDKDHLSPAGEYLQQLMIQSTRIPCCGRSLESKGRQVYAVSC